MSGAAVVEQRAQSDLFEDAARWPRRPYCSDDPRLYGTRIRTLKVALRRPYIQANPPRLRVWSIYDVDRAGAGMAWDDAGLPAPSWAAINGQNGHAHLVWGLSAPVLVESDDARRAPIRYLVAVESAFRERLKADPGYGGLLTKNPAHPLWRVLRGPTLGYELGELAEWVDLPRHLPRPSARADEIGLGRNCTLFDWLRRWSYVAVRRHRDLRNFIVWQAEAYDRALERNGEFRCPLDSREVWHIARSVARWTWARDATAHAAFARRQASRGQIGGVASGIARAAASEDKRASARLMQAQGMKQREIAAELDVGLRTIERWLRTP